MSTSCRSLTRLTLLCTLLCARTGFHAPLFAQMGDKPWGGEPHGPGFAHQPPPQASHGFPPKSFAHNDRQQKLLHKYGRTLKLLKTFDRPRADAIWHLLKKAPHEAHRMLEQSRHEMLEILNLRKRSPKRFKRLVKRRKYESEAERLARKIRKTHAPDIRKELEVSLRKVLELLFPLRCLELEYRITDVNRELDKLKSLLERKRKAKKQIIEHRFNQLTGKGDYLEW